MVYFIGNILDSHAEADQHPERSTKHFHITPDEAASIDATGLPVHLEHANNVQVGTVSRSWNDANGRKWVLVATMVSEMISCYILLVATTLNALYVGMFIMGLGHPGRFVIMINYVDEFFTTRQKDFLLPFNQFL